MTKQDNSKKAKTNSVAPKTVRAPSIVTEDPAADRKRLLAHVAGQIACGVVQSPSPATSSSANIAAISVEIAEKILEQVGL